MARRAAVDRRAPPTGVLRHMRAHVHGAQLVDEVGSVIALVGAQADAGRTVGALLDHRQRGDALAMAVGGRETGVDDEAGTVLHQRVTEKGQFRLHARSLAIEPRIRIGGRGVRLVRTLLALEIDLDIAAAAGRRFVARSVLALEALYRRPGLDERAVDREMVTRQQR